MPAASHKVPVPDQILGAATRIFAARGVDAASLQAIADAVGIRKASLLYHFPSKDALRQAVLEEILGHWNRALPALLAAASSGLAQFDNVVGELLAFFHADRDRARLLMREILDRPAEVRALLDSHIEPWIAIVASHIRRGQERDGIDGEVDPEAYAVHVINLVLAGFVTHDCLRLVSDERHQGELLRICKSSLFPADDAASGEPGDEG